MTFRLLGDQGLWPVLVQLLVLIYLSQAQQGPFYMDQKSTCGERVVVGAYDVIVSGKGNVAAANPPTECIVIFESGQKDTNYRLHVIIEAVHITDCAYRVTVFNGEGAYGSPLRSLSCGSPSTGHIYTKESFMTVRLTQPISLYQTNNDFDLRIKTYRDPDEDPTVSGTSKLTAGAIVGIILGLVAIIAVAILLCWCVKSGRLGFEKGMNSPVFKSRDNINNSEKGTENPSTETFDKESVSTVSKGNFNLNDPRMWSSLTSTESKPRPNRTEALKSLSKEPATGRSNGGQYAKKGQQPLHEEELRRNGRYVTQGSTSQGQPRGQQGTSSPGRIRGRKDMYSDGKPGDDAEYQNIQNSEYENYRKDGEVYENVPRNNSRFQRTEAAKPNSMRDKREQNKGTGKSEETGMKRPHSGLFDNPDDEGYLYDYDQVKSLSSDDIENLDKGKSRTDPTNTGKSPKNQKRTGNLPETSGTLDSLLAKNDRYLSQDELSEPADPEKMSNPMLNISHSAIKSAVSEKGPEPFESPSAQKKSNKKTDESSDPVKTTSSPKKDISKPSDEPLPETKDINEPSSNTFKPIKEPKGLSDDKKFDSSLPPEAYAPIFANDPATMEHYYPTQPQQPQYGYPAPYGYEQPGMMAPYFMGDPNEPYAQAGQAAWFVQAMPTAGGPMKQSTFMMASTHTTPSNSAYDDPMNQYPAGGNGYYDPQTGTPYGDITHPGPPGYTSTPSAFTPHKRGHRGPHHHGHRSKPKSSPYYPENYPVTPGGPVNPRAVIPAGTVLDDPYVPGPGGTVVRSGEDPHTGAHVNQVVWTDTNPDPTDPIGIDPQITRKTITRVTTKSNTQGGLSDPPNPTLNELSFRAAQQLRDGVDPAFLSPSKSKHQALTYTPQPVYTAQEPTRDHVGFYTNLPQNKSHSSSSFPGSAAPIVHQAPAQSRAIKDSISLSQLQEHDDI